MNLIQMLKATFCQGTWKNSGIWCPGNETGLLPPTCSQSGDKMLCYANQAIVFALISTSDHTAFKMGSLRQNTLCCAPTSLALSLQYSIRLCEPLIKSLLGFPSAPSQYLDCDLPHWLSSLRQWSNTHAQVYVQTLLTTYLINHN